jgi:hypothetical protein
MVYELKTAYRGKLTVIRLENGDDFPVNDENGLEQWQLAWYYSFDFARYMIDVIEE